ncbi:hypothetical protein P2A91_22710, partial [Xanthomonas perforans]
LGGLGAVGRKELRHRQSSLELHSVDAHLATSLTLGDDTINPAWRRSCDCWLKVGANQVACWEGAGHSVCLRRPSQHFSERPRNRAILARTRHGKIASEEACSSPMFNYIVDV